MRGFNAVLVASLFGLVSGVSAQQPPPIHPGARVRVSAPTNGIQNIVGTFSGYDDENIAVKPDHGQNTVWVPLTSVTKFEQLRGRKSNKWQGAGIGLLAGGVVGAAAGVLTYEECASEGWFGCFLAAESSGEALVRGGLVGGLLGAGLGTLIATFIKTDRWEEVPLDRLRVSFAPRRDGFAVGLLVSF